MSIMTRVTAALAGASMLAVSLSPASALTLSSTSLNAVASPQVEKVWWRGCGWGCGGGGWGWGPGAVIGGLAAGAIVGGALAAPYYGGPGYYGAPGYYGPCWRRWVGPYGGVQWRRVC
jgi:hypothetical protein